MGTNECCKAVKLGSLVKNSVVALLLKAKARKSIPVPNVSSNKVHISIPVLLLVCMCVCGCEFQRLFIFSKPFVRSLANRFPGLGLEFSASHSQDFQPNPDDTVPFCLDLFFFK